jgi:hypothetical protein
MAYATLDNYSTDPRGWATIAGTAPRLAHHVSCLRHPDASFVSQNIKPLPLLQER